MNFWSVLIISVVYFYTRTTGLVPQKLPESWKCADPKCSVPISEAKPVLKQYNSLRNLSLRKDQKVIIYGKGSKTYDVEVDGKRGHIPKSVVMETRVLVRDADLKHVVTAENIDTPFHRADRVEVNVKVSSMEPAIDIVNLTPEMPPPVMQGAFLLAGAAADSSLPKVPNAPGASSIEDDKTPAEVREVVEEGLPEDGLDAEDTLETVQNEPPESVNNIEATLDTTVNDSAKVEDSNEGLANDNVPQSAAQEIEDTNAAEKEPVHVADEAAVGFGGGLFGFLGATLDSKEDDEEEDEEGMEREGAEDMEELEGTDVEKEEERLVERGDGTAEKQDEIVRKEEVVESAGDPKLTGNLEVPETGNLKNEVFDSVKLPVGIEIDLGAEKDNNGSQQEDIISNFTEKEGELDTVEAERIVEASNFTEKQEKPDTQTERLVEPTLEETQTEKIVDSKFGEVQPENIVESVEKVGESTLGGIQPEKIVESIEKVGESTLGATQPEKIIESVEKVDKLDLNVSGGMEGDNATEVVEAEVVGGTYEEKIGGVPKDGEKIGGMYGGVPKDEVKIDGLYSGAPKDDAKIGGMYSGVPKDEVKIGGMYGGVPKDEVKIDGLYSGAPKDDAKIGGMYSGVPKYEVKIGGMYGGVPKDGGKIGDMYGGVPKDEVKIGGMYGGVPKDDAKIGGVPKYGENINGMYGGVVPNDEEKKEEEGRGGRVKRDFMYQQNQYAYNTPPNYQQQQHNYGGRMNDYNNNNNYRQYKTEYPNAYAYQHQHGNMHHQHNMEGNMHHKNMYHSTQQPSKVEPITAGTIKPSASVTSSQETLTTTEEPAVADKQDYEEEVTKKGDDKDVSKEQDYEGVTKKQDSEDISIEVDDHSGEVVTEKVEETFETTTEILPSSSEATNSETLEVTDRPEAEIEAEKEHLTTQPPREEIIVDLDEETESESGWFSMRAITDLFASEKSVEDPKSTTDDVATSSLSSSEEEPKLTDGKCSSDDVACKLDNLEEKLLHGDLPSDPFISESDELLGALMDGLQKTSSGPIFCLIVTACAVVGFSLGYNFIENRKREGELVAKINSLEKANLVEKKEKNQLKDKLLHVSETSTLSSEAESSYLTQIAALTEEKNTLLAEKRDLEDQLMETERDLQTATESNLEMNNLLSESLSTPDGSTVLLETVDKLKAKLENQNMEMKELNRLLNEKSEDIDSIRKELKANQEAKKSLQEKLTTLKRENDEEMLQLKESNRDLSTQLDDLMESKSLEKLKLSNELSRLQITLTETQTALGDRNGEIDALKDLISRLKTDLKEEELNNLYDVASVTGKLTQAEAERECFKEKFLEEEGARKLLEGHVQVISQEVASLKENYEAAEKEKIEALTKVQVLSNYFKEKETQLQKELGLKESMWLQKQSDDNTIYEQMKSLREENERYKTNQLQQHASQGQLISQHHHHQIHHNQQASPNGVLCVTKKKKKKVKGNPPGSLQPAPGSQLESLQKEIRESETDYKSQIAKAEQKSYENWLTSRQFERKLKETQGEATQLRNMLTMIEKNSTNHSTDDLKQSISEVSNGDPSSPPPRFLPPPPTSPPFMMFQPPPPLYPSPDAAPTARPPTLGRISSPPLDHHHPRFSPPPPHPPYLFDPPPFPHPQHSPSPPPPLPHRPLPKPPHMSPNDRKESMSPGYSEHHDRPNRRSKR